MLDYRIHNLITEKIFHTVSSYPRLDQVVHQGYKEKSQWPNGDNDYDSGCYDNDGGSDDDCDDNKNSFKRIEIKHENS